MHNNQPNRTLPEMMVSLGLGDDAFARYIKPNLVGSDYIGTVRIWGCHQSDKPNGYWFLTSDLNIKIYDDYAAAKDELDRNLPPDNESYARHHIVIGADIYTDINFSKNKFSDVALIESSV